MPADDVTTGELARRMDGLHGDVLQIRDLLLALPQQYVPRRELDERRGADLARVAAVEKRDETSRLTFRWRLGLVVPSLLSLTAISVTASQFIH